MINSQVTITDTATPRLKQLYSRVAPGRRRLLMRRLGKVLEVALRKHFKRQNLDSNITSKRAKKGFPQAGIWHQIRQQTALAQVTDNTAAVSGLSVD